jgi:glutamate-ammonia-ligase adenylyltransferase
MTPDRSITLGDVSLPVTSAVAVIAGESAAQHSRFVTRVRRRWPDALALLAPGAPTRPSIAALIDALRERGAGLDSALRVARHVVIERLAVLDTEHGAPLDVVTHAMTWLAEETLERALTQALADADARWGVPRNDAGKRIDFWILGMGKLGARELNVSSDIDLIYVYDDDGETDGVGPEGAVLKRVSTQEYFAAVARSLQARIGEATDDGFVFRVDLALRPNGNSGPPAVSLGMLEEYFLVQGREWERFAWLKSRVVAPAASIAAGRPKAGLLPLVSHFVYRRYLDYGVFEGLRQLHRKIRDEAQRRAAGRPERANDVKLSRGGIREIEFIVQCLQVVRGGQFPELRTRSTLRGLERATAHGLMKPPTAQRLAQAYVLLRRIEHRIQYLDDQQTHLLPSADDDVRWIAGTLGFDSEHPDCGLLQALAEAREFVATEFDALLHDGKSAAPSCNGKGCGAQAPSLDSDAFVESLPAALKRRVEPLLASAKVQTLRDASRTRLARLLSRLAADMRADRTGDEAAVRFVDWLDPLLRRDSYLALLDERPVVQQRLVRLLGLARWPMRYLMRHPAVIDELADEALLAERFDRAAFAAELEARHAAWHRAQDASEESLLDALRHMHHAEVFRTLVRDVEGTVTRRDPAGDRAAASAGERGGQGLTVEQVADDLSALADVTLDACIRWAWQHVKQRHRDEPRFAVIAYGKLGGKELGYGSDLDLVFLYDDDDECAPEVYGAFVRKLISWLTVRTAAGELFEIDTALRPNGNSGLLVTSLASFENYQVGRGSNTAWTWEHQAITRARWCAGAGDLAERFEGVRRTVLGAPRDEAALAQEIQAMRRKVQAGRPVRGTRFDVKLSPGGMMDAEFAVQHLVLAHSARHPQLQGNVGNIALMRLAEDAGLLPAGVGTAAADGYRELRRAQHRARLDEQPTAFDLEAAQAEPLVRARDAIMALWHAVFGVSRSGS